MISVLIFLFSLNCIFIIFRLYRWPKDQYIKMYVSKIHRPCEYMPLPPLMHANPSLLIGKLGEWWKRGKSHTGSLT